MEFYENREIPCYLLWMHGSMLCASLLLMLAHLPYGKCMEELKFWIAQLKFFFDSSSEKEADDPQEEEEKCGFWWNILPFFGSDWDDGLDMERWLNLPFLENGPDEPDIDEPDIVGRSNLVPDPNGYGSMREINNGMELEEEQQVPRHFFVNAIITEYPAATTKPKDEKHISKPLTVGTSKNAHPILSVKRESIGKYFGHSEFEGIRKMDMNGTTKFTEGKLKGLSAVNLKMDNKTKLSFYAGDIDIVVKISNESKKTFMTKFRGIQKKLEQKKPTVNKEVDGAYCGVKMDKRARIIMISSYIKSEQRTNLEMTVSMNLKAFKVRKIEFNHENIDVSIFVTNVGCLFRPVVGRKLKKELNKMNAKDLWNKLEMVTEPNEGLFGNEDNMAASYVGYAKRSKSKWNKFCGLFCAGNDVKDQ